jgi:hypothetical protein
MTLCHHSFSIVLELTDWTSMVRTCGCNNSLYIHDCCLIFLYTSEGVVLGCRRNLYIIDDFCVNDKGELEEKPVLLSEQTIKYQVSVGTRKDCQGTPMLCLKVDKLKAEKGQTLPTMRKPSQCQKWPYSSIRELHKRTYQLQSVGVEFFHINGSNFLLVFPSMNQRNQAFDKIMNQDLSEELKDASLSVVQAEAQHGASADATNVGPAAASGAAGNRSIVSTVVNVFTRGITFKKSVTQRWVEGEMSNFAYLMYLNTLAGRTYNDLTQYPVFPWVLSDYTSAELNLNDINVYRDLSKPMGALGATRAAEFQRRYETWDDDIIPPFHYGTHYSMSAGVLYYLIRLEPYTKIALELQGGKFDHADRLFFSVAHAWNLSSSAGGMSDVKELIPEFYSLPEFLCNNNHWDLGGTQKGTVVDDVVLPPWAKGDAKRFIRMHRAALESPYVSAHLHEWIDLIFGYKQKGQAAIDAQNVFYYLTYPGAIDIDAIEDPVERMSTISQINNFGQVRSVQFTSFAAHDNNHYNIITFLYLADSFTTV